MAFLVRSEKSVFLITDQVEQTLSILPVLQLHSPNPTHRFIVRFQHDLETFFINTFIE